MTERLGFPPLGPGCARFCGFLQEGKNSDRCPGSPSTLGEPTLMDHMPSDPSSAAYQALAGEILRAPEFPRVRDVLVEGFLRLYDNNHLINRLILEEGRYMAFLSLLALHAAQDMRDSSTWLTLGRLQKVVTQHGFASRNRVEAQVSSLKKYGFLVQQAQPSDRRVRLLVPTEKTITRDMASVNLHLQALNAIGLDLPNCGVPVSAGTYRAFRRETLPHLGMLSRFFQRHALMAPFVGHDCGYVILLLLLRGATRHDGTDVATCYQQIATQTGVSRTHVRRLIEAVRDADLLTVNARGGHDIRLTERMWHFSDRWFAESLALTAYLLRRSADQVSAAET
ncbi:hypothetical protein LXM94_11605 [Rhizobium sp. TRM95111]|uniref:hypothetical protein n=1 Tax=Rhizobium alarense TaxID=2846851 RepID=UPI001F1E1A59|nr:hypothetical protein [Rhizobium alarense]MCF3640610.1 hypothetical protein [Rhizobium alarense]